MLIGMAAATNKGLQIARFVQAFIPTSRRSAGSQIVRHGVEDLWETRLIFP